MSPATWPAPARAQTLDRGFRSITWWSGGHGRHTADSRLVPWSSGRYTHIEQCGHLPPRAARAVAPQVRAAEEMSGRHPSSILAGAWGQDRLCLPVTSTTWKHGLSPFQSNRRIPSRSERVHGAAVGGEASRCNRFGFKLPHVIDRHLGASWMSHLLSSISWPIRLIWLLRRARGGKGSHGRVQRPDMDSGECHRAVDSNAESTALWLVGVTRRQRVARTRRW